jgi:hypothetical protein
MNRVVLIAMPLFLGGCYTYAPVQASALQPGMGVRARVSASTAERIAPLLGMSDARVLTGKLIERSAGALIVEVPTTVQAGQAGAVQSLSQRISIAPGEIVDLESRRLDRARTAIVVGAVGVVTISSAIAALHNDPGTNTSGGGSSPPESRIPIWRWHF